MNHLKITATLTVLAVTATTAMLAQEIRPRMAQEPIVREGWGQSPSSVAKPRTTHPGPPIVSSQHLHNLRVRKCKYVVSRLYPQSGFLPYCDYFIREHERLGMEDDWLWSLSYGGANCSLRCHIRFRNGCAGPMDRPGGSTDPHKNIRAHCEEGAYYRHTKGESGYQLMRRIFYPARPHDWGGKRIWRRYQQHVRAIEKGYRRGELP